MLDSPSPQLVLDTMLAYQNTEVLRTAIALDVFGKLGGGWLNAAQLAERCSAAEKGVRILCDHLTVLGFLEKSGTRYALSPISALYLDPQAPAYLGGTLEFLHAPTLRNGFAALTEAVRKGGTVQSPGGFTDPEHPDWLRFARAMAPLMTIQVSLVPSLIERPHSAPLKVLDIAAGHGMFGIELARRFSNAQVTALDWPGVLEFARENAQRAGVGSRYGTIAGSAFEVSLGADYDVVLIPNFLHHFRRQLCVQFLRKVVAALKPDGVAVTVEFVPDENRVTPPLAAGFALTMLVATAEGDAYTLRELESMFDEAGFAHNVAHALPPSAQHAIVSTKANSK